MKKILFLEILLAIPLLAYGHEDAGTTPHAEGEAELCGAPVPGEATASNETVFFIAAGILLGAVLAIAGLSRKLPKHSMHAGILLVLLTLAYYLIATPGYNPRYASFGVAGTIHEHADFLAVLDGADLYHSQEDYMSTLSSPKSMFVHLHDGDGTVIHKHAPSVPVSYLFETIGMKLTDDCFSDGQKDYCTDGEKKLLLLVNGNKAEHPAQYVLKDGDKILLWWGSDDQTAIAAATGRIGNLACIHSNKCPLPEGFVLQPESGSTG